MASDNNYRLPVFEKLSVSIFFTIFIIKVLEALCFFRHGDALNYHLVGPRFWLETSWLEMTNDLWGNFQSGLFELLYLLTIGIFGNSLWGQLSSQLLHFLLGQGLAAFILFSYFKKKNSIVAALSGIAILTISKSGDFFLYAKNDGFLAAMGLFALILILDKNYLKVEGSSRSILIGALLGLLPAVKMSGLFVTAPLAIYYVYLNRKDIFQILLAGSMSLLVFSPILIRNYYFIGNPFFPGLINIFPGVLTPEMKSYYLHHMSNPLSWDSLAKSLSSVFLGKVIFLFSFPVLILKFRSEKNFKPEFFAYTTFVLYLLVNGGLVVERFFFTTYFFIIFGLAKFLLAIKLDKLKIIAILFLLLVDSKIDKSFKRISHYFPLYLNSNPMDIVHEASPYASLWKNVPPSNSKKLVISDLFAQQFYAPRGIRIHQFRGRPDVEFLGTCTHQDVELLEKYSYAILASQIENPCYLHIRQNGKVLKSIELFTLYEL